LRFQSWIQTHHSLLTTFWMLSIRVLLVDYTCSFDCLK
jgi:hypothetical protein